MAVNIYKVFNAAMPTTASILKATTSTGIHTQVQLAPPTSKDVAVVGWGVSFDGSAAGTSITCEVIETDVAATMANAHVAAGLMTINNPGGSVSQCQLGASLTGWGPPASVEGTITAVRVGDAQLIQPTNQYIYDFLLGYEFVIRSGKFGRIRINAGAAVNCLCYLMYAE